MSTFKILDGAMGSELIRWGMELPEHIWSAAANLTNPELVLEIHREYVDAGADYITANTFRTTPRAFDKLDSLVAEPVEVNKKDAVFFCFFGVLRWFSLFLGVFRCFGCFSVLFGAGVCIFMERAEAKAHDAWQLQLSRMGWLLFIGLVA